jgi:hypothetical protein
VEQQSSCFSFLVRNTLCARLTLCQAAPEKHIAEGWRTEDSGCQSPEAIEELLRILRIHLGLKSEPTLKVAAFQ